MKVRRSRCGVRRALDPPREGEETARDQQRGEGHERPPRQGRDVGDSPGSASLKADVRRREVAVGAEVDRTRPHAGRRGRERHEEVAGREGRERVRAIVCRREVAGDLGQTLLEPGRAAPPREAQAALARGPASAGQRPRIACCCRGRVPVYLGYQSETSDQPSHPPTSRPSKPPARAPRPAGTTRRRVRRERPT